MDLFKRLFGMARAQLNLHLQGKGRSGFGNRGSAKNSENYQKTYGNQHQTHSGQSYHRATGHPKAKDPVLAQYYANLELPYGANLQEVRKAWKTLMRKYHPDLHSLDEDKKRIAVELTQALNHAYSELEKHLGPG